LHDSERVGDMPSPGEIYTVDKETEGREKSNYHMPKRDGSGSRNGKQGQVQGGESNVLLLYCVRTSDATLSNQVRRLLPT
jgi:hypothetical protein